MPAAKSGVIGDGICSETIDGESSTEQFDEDKVFDVMTLREMVKKERLGADSTLLELERERIFAAIAAEESMAMILRLQSEKSVAEMELKQYKRVNFFSNYAKILKSGTPQRLMFNMEGDWIDYSQDILASVKNDLQLKRATAKIQINESHFLLDFLHMLQVDLDTGLKLPIVWIDEAGHCFFPESVVDYSLSHCAHSKNNQDIVPVTQADGMKLQIEIVIGRADILKIMESGGESSVIVNGIQVHQKFNCIDVFDI